MNTKSKRLRDWAASVPPLLAFAAIRIADSSKDTWEVLVELSRGQSAGWLRPLPPAKRWMKLYRKHRMIGELVGLGLGMPEADRHLANDYGAELHRIGQMTPQEKADLVNSLSAEEKQEIATAILEAPREWIRIIADEISLIEEDAPRGIINPPDKLDALRASDDIQFVYRVLVPCWIRYRSYPFDLLRAARAGEINSIVALLELDKTAVSDPKICEHIREAAQVGNSARLKRMAMAIASTSLGRFNLARVKCESAALIGRVAEDLKHPLTEPRIRELFDALAVIRGKQRDTDLPASSEAFAKALQRNKPQWIPMIRGTKVHAQLSG